MDKRYLMMGLVLIMLAAAAKAVAITGSCSSSGYQCDLKVNNLRACNDSGHTETYNANVGGEVSNWLSIIPENFTLAAGECRDLKIYTISDCYADPGTYKAEITVRNGSPVTTYCDVVIKQGHKVDIEVMPESQSATQCEEKNYTVRLTNNSPIKNQQTEKVYLDIQGLPIKWYELKDGMVFVTKGVPEETSLKVQAPCDAELGEYPFWAVGSLINPNFKSSDEGKYILAQGQDLDIDTGLGTSPREICTGEATSQKITITNNGKLDDNVRLTLDGPGWAKLSTSSISLSPGKSASVTVNLTPGNAEQKAYDIKVLAESTKYNYTEQAAMSIDLQKCYDLAVEKISGEETACAEQNPAYVFKVTNKGTKELDVRASLLGISAKLDKTSFKIQPGESRNVEATLDVSGLAKEGEVIKEDVKVALELVMDTSGSMIESIEGKRKMDIAKEVATSFVNKVSDVELGLRVFGQGDECEDSRQLRSVTALNIPMVTDSISAMTPMGKTPMANALENAIADLKGKENKAVILVSDGKETCDGDPRAAAVALRENSIKVYAIGFSIDEEGKKELEDIARITGGKYFDAENASDLAGVFDEIGQTLKIIPAVAGERDFSLKVTATKATVEKKYSLMVEDCYNSLMLLPSLNLCKGVPSNDTLEIRNLGTQAQTFTLDVKPGWVSADSSVTIQPNTTEKVALAITPPKDASDRALVAEIKSAEQSAQDSKSINYLSSESCFGIVLLGTGKVDVNTCDTETVKLIVENKGATKQTITLASDKAWVYLDTKTLALEKGERGEVFVLVSPPFDLTEQETTATITATTDFGYQARMDLKIRIFGTEASRYPINLILQNPKVINRETEKGMEVDFSIMNDSNRTVRIVELAALQYPAELTISGDIIDPAQSKTAKMFITLPENYQGDKIMVPIKATTHQGTFVKNLIIALEKQGGKEDLGAGLFNLANTGMAIVAGLVVAVVALIGYALYRERGLKNGKGKPKDAAQSTLKGTPKSVPSIVKPPQGAESAKPKAKPAPKGKPKDK